MSIPPPLSSYTVSVPDQRLDFHVAAALDALQSR